MSLDKPEIWWKQPWPWIVIGMLGTTVVASLVTLVIAASTTDSLVSDDYTRQGKTINKRLAKDDFAERMGIRLTPELQWVADDLLQIQLKYRAVDSSAVAPPFLRLTLSHPTLADRDTSVSLVQIQPGLYQAQVSGLSTGHWHAITEPPAGDWRVRSRLDIQPKGVPRP